MRKFSVVTLQTRPITLNQAATVTEACDRMRDGQAGSVLVTDNSGTLVGIFTGRDAVCRVLAQRRDAATTPLAEVMTANPTTMLPDQTDSRRVAPDEGWRLSAPAAGEESAGSWGSFPAANSTASGSVTTKKNATSGNTCADHPAFPAPGDQWAMRTGTVMLDSKVRLAPPRITSCSREWP